MSIDRLLITPFSLSVLNVAIMLTLLIAFLLRIPDKSPATRSVLVFLAGVDMVFFAFFHIFSSLDLHSVTLAWWLLHAVIFFILFLVGFSYTYPRPHFDREARQVRQLLAFVSLLVYAGYLYHTTLIEPVFAPGGYLFVFLGTPEVGIVIGAMLAWAMIVFWRTTRWLATTVNGNTALTARQISAIRKLMLVLLSPVVLVTFIILAYQGLASWELVGHLLGSGLIIFVFLFTVIYLNNSVEPTTLLVKVVGLSLGAILILLGFASSITMNIHKASFLANKESEITRSLAIITPAGQDVMPEDIAYVASDRGVIYRQATIAPTLEGKRVPWEEGWSFRQTNGNDPHGFYIAHTLEHEGIRYEVGYSYLSFRSYIHTMAQPLAMLALGAALFVLIVFPLFFRLSLFNPLRRLLEGVAAVEEGRLDTHVPVIVGDEIGRLTRSFNHMTGSVRDSSERLRSAFDYQRDLTDAYSRFVPREILTTLNKQTILELGLGDSVQKEMTILFSDIRAFTTLSEQMTPREVFQFINRYLERVGPVVRQHGGYIDKYIGDAVMALFPNGAEHAVAAAIEMQQQVRLFNREYMSGADDDADGHVQRQTIRVGIGIHTGELMLGTIGEHERMEGTVIADAVNLASRLESLTKVYDAPIIISGNTLVELANDGRYAIRTLDRVRVRGKSEWVEIHEVIDGDHGDRHAHKIARRESFEAAIAAFRAAHFKEAESLFRELHHAEWNDPTIVLYLQRCAQFSTEEISADWDGAVSL